MHDEFSSMYVCVHKGEKVRLSSSDIFVHWKKDRSTFYLLRFSLNLGQNYSSDRDSDRAATEVADSTVIGALEKTNTRWFNTFQKKRVTISELYLLIH